MHKGIKDVWYCNKIIGTDKNIASVFVAGKQVVPFEVEKALEGEQIT